MTLQWPRECDAGSGQSFDSFSFDPEDGIRRLLVACPSVMTDDAFKEAIGWITQGSDDISGLECRMGDICSALKLDEFPESENLLKVLVCAEALAASPTLTTWKMVRTLKSNSWQLEHWLSGVMMVCAEFNAGKREAYISLAKKLFEALDNFTLVSQFDRYNHEREQFRIGWEERENKLEEIWWGFRGYECSQYEELPIFGVFATLAPTEFIGVVSQSQNPHLVNSAIEASGASTNFRLWAQFTILAPMAFAEEGTWNGSLLTPLLLVTARDELMQADSLSSRRGASDDETEHVKQEIANLSAAIVEALAKRSDALPLFARWSTWLMRQSLMHNKKLENNIRPLVAVDDPLIEAIGKGLKGEKPIPQSSADAPAWEAWCYRAVLASHAHYGFIDVPDCEGFLAEWEIGFDDWPGAQGKQLRERANLIVTMSSDIPGEAAHSLAYPIAMAVAPVDKWNKLWEKTVVLREIVEFDDEYQERSEAGKLLLLVFCMGLAILDQRVALHTVADSPHSKDLIRLHKALALAVREMREIDDTLNRERWQQAFRHLAVRRLIWEKNISNANTGQDFAVFLSTDKPTFSDYLIEIENDAMEIFAVLQMAKLNGSRDKIVREKLRAASIDPSKIVAMIRQLNQISNRRYPINETQLDEIFHPV